MRTCHVCAAWWNAQVRERASDGSILKYTADPAVTGALSRPARDLSGAGNAAARMTQAAGVRGGVEWSASGSGLTPTLSARSGAASENAALRGTSPASAVSMSSRASVSSQSLDEPVSSEGEECDTSETGDEEASTSGEWCYTNTRDAHSHHMRHAQLLREVR